MDFERGFGSGGDMVLAAFGSTAAIRLRMLRHDRLS